MSARGSLVRRCGGGFAAAWLIAATVALTLGPVLPLQAGEMQQTEPGHLLPPFPEDGVFNRLAPTRMPHPSQVVLREDKSWRKGGTVEKDLSLACRAGRFNERRPMMYRAFFSDDVLGVAFGHGLNLLDPEHKAKRALIYLFHFAGTNACQVLSRANPDPGVATK